MTNNVIPSGGDGAVEFDDSAEAGSAEGRLSLLRALVEDMIRSSESSFSKEIKVDDKIWSIRAEKISG